MIYTNNNFAGHYPVGTSAVVQANTPEEAAELLERELANHGLEQEVQPEDMVSMPQGMKVRILQDGDY